MVDASVEAGAVRARGKSVAAQPQACGDQDEPRAWLASGWSASPPPPPPAARSPGGRAELAAGDVEGEEGSLWSCSPPEDLAGSSEGEAGLGGESRCEGTEISNVGAGGAGAGGEQRAKQEGAWFILRHQMWSFLRTESETKIHQSGMIHGLGYYCFRWNKVCVCVCVCAQRHSRTRLSFFRTGLHSYVYINVYV